MKHPFKSIGAPVQPDLSTYNKILKLTEGFPGVRENCVIMFVRGISSVTGFGLMDIYGYIKDHPDDDFYDIEDMARTFKAGKI